MDAEGAATAEEAAALGRQQAICGIWPIKLVRQGMAEKSAALTMRDAWRQCQTASGGAALFAVTKTAKSQENKLSRRKVAIAPSVYLTRLCILGGFAIFINF